MVAAVQGVLEEGALPGLVRVGGGVGQVEDVAEAELPGRGVVLEQGPGRVQPAYGVGDAPLHGLRHVPPVRRRPAGEQFPGLVGAPEHGVDHGPVGRAAGRPGQEPGPYVRGGAHQGRGAHVALGAQPAQQAGRPVRVLDGEFAHEPRVPVVALLAALVEGPLGDEVADGEEEQFLAGLPYEGRAAFVGVRARRKGGVVLDRSGHGAGGRRDVRGHEHVGPDLGHVPEVTTRQ